MKKILILAGGYSKEKEISKKTSKSVFSELKKDEKYNIKINNPDGKIVTVVMNKTNQNIDYKLIVGEYEARLSILPHSIQSLIY